VRTSLQHTEVVPPSPVQVSAVDDGRASAEASVSVSEPAPFSFHWCYRCGQPATLCINGAWWDVGCANRRFGADRLAAVSTLLRRVSRRPTLLRGRAV